MTINNFLIAVLLCAIVIGVMAIVYNDHGGI